MQKIDTPQKIGGASEGRRYRALLHLAGIRVEDAAAVLGISRDSLYRSLRDDRKFSDAERAALDALTAPAA